MEFFDVVCKRTSIREYKSEPVNEELLEKIAEAGRRAPTARAQEPWEFVIIRDADVLKKISQIAPNGQFIINAAAAIVVFCRDTKYYLEDGCAATENILLAVADAGLGACWIAGDKKDYAGEIQELLRAPKNYKLVSIIAIGMPLTEKPQVKKRSLKEMLHWDNF